MLEGLKLMREAGQKPDEAPAAPVVTRARRQRPAEPAPDPAGDIPEFGAVVGEDHARRNLNIRVSKPHHDAFYALYRELVGKGWPVRHGDVMEAILGELLDAEGRKRVVRRLQEALAER